MENNSSDLIDALRYVYLSQEQYDSIYNKSKEKEELENKNKEEVSKK